jgi:hypothetical protein
MYKSGNSCDRVLSCAGQVGLVSFTVYQNYWEVGAQGGV